MPRQKKQPESKHRDSPRKPDRAGGAFASGETFLQKTVENAGSILFRLIFGPKPGSGYYDFVSEGIISLTGLKSGEFTEKKYQEMIEEIHPLLPGIPKDHHECRRAFIAGLIPCYKADVCLRWADGRMRWIFDSSVPLRDPASGKIIGSYGILQDITERKTIEKYLALSEEKYRNLIENIHEVIYSLDQDGFITFISSSVERMGGYKPEELVGHHFSEFIYHEDLSHIQKQFQKLAQNVLEPDEYRVIRKDGEVRWIYSSSRPILRDNRFVGVNSIMADIHERKMAQLALQREQELVERIMKTATVGIVVVDMRGRITYANEFAEKVLGLSRDDIQARTYNDPAWRISDYEGNPFPEDDLPFPRVMREGQPVFGIRHAIEWPDGKRVLLSVNAAPLRDEAGRPEGMVAIISDITEQKRMEEQLRHAQKMEAIGTLAGGIAHDFNNMLMGIQGRASLMLMDCSFDSPNYEHLKGIEEYVRSASELTHQLLGLARGGKYEVVPADLNDVIRRSTEMFGRAKKEIKIHLKLQPDLWIVEVDRTQIEQVLLNLYVNAWQAMPEGGEMSIVSKNIELNENEARVYQVKPGRFVRTSVTDTGIGMDEVTKNRIFDPFFTTKEMGRGTGLGLASAYGIIQNHGGIVTVYSEKGTGSTFNIYLPASQKKIYPKDEKETELVRGSGTILLIDDEEMIIDVARQLLESLGYRVLAAVNGQQALEVYWQNRDTIDMVILDMIMPQMSGGKVFERLKEINPEVKVLLSSGYSLNGQAVEIMKRGCRGFIQKPFTIKELSQKVSETLKR